MSAANESPSSRPHVLIVDDEAILVEEIAEFLTDEDFVVTTAFDGAQALTRFRAATPGTFTVVLTDLRMPGLDGYELAAALRREETDDVAIEIVLLTGHGTLDGSADTAFAGFHQCVRKPVRLTDLSGILLEAHETALKRRRRARISAADATGGRPEE